MTADPSASLLSTGSSAFRGPSSRLTDGSRTLVSRPSYNTILHEEPLENGSIAFPELEGRDPAEQLEILKGMLEKATKLKDGAANLLEMNITVSWIYHDHTLTEDAYLKGFGPSACRIGGRPGQCEDGDYQQGNGF